MKALGIALILMHTDDYIKYRAVRIVSSIEGSLLATHTIFSLLFMESNTPIRRPCNVFKNFSIAEVSPQLSENRNRFNEILFFCKISLKCLMKNLFTSYLQTIYLIKGFRHIYI